MATRICPHCDTPCGGPHWHARATTIWANQHGKCYRVFCDVCGAWHDVRVLGEQVTVRQVKAPRLTIQVQIGQITRGTPSGILLAENEDATG